MTKRDFIEIAHVLDANRAGLEIVLDMADMLEDTNPLFDRARFIDAATVEFRAGLASTTRILNRALEGN